MARPKGTTKAKKAISKFEFSKLLDFVSKNHTIQHKTKSKLKLAYTLLYITGCRISEINQLTKADLDFMIEFKEYSLTNSTKTKQPRLISFSQIQLDLLRKVVPTEDGFCFKKNASAKAMSISGLTSLCNEYIQRALGELYSSHGFRRNMITQILLKTGRVKIAQQHIGHKSSSTTTRYDSPTQEDIYNTLKSINWWK